MICGRIVLLSSAMALRVPALLVAMLLATLGGCSTIHKDHKPETVKPRELPPPEPRTDGAIYQAGQEMVLFADLKARHVGDVLTIVLNEATNASKSAVTKTTKNSVGDRHRTDDLRQVHHHQGRADPRHHALGRALLRRRGLERAEQQPGRQPHRHRGRGAGATATWWCRATRA